MRGEAAARALAAKRGLGFWIAGALAATLPCMSWMNVEEVAYCNSILFGRSAKDPAGWWIYLAVRLALVGLLLWTIWQFPVRAKTAMPLKTPGPSTPRPQEKLFDPLMGLRALACVLVMMGHYFLVVFRFEPTPRDHVFAPFLRSSPWAGVWLFFTLSGFLMGKGFASGRYTTDETGSRACWFNRMLRIAPVYYFGLLLATVFRYPQLFLWRNWWMLIEICIFDYRGDLPMNPAGALWSVSTEVQFYLLVPLFMVLLLHIRGTLGRWFPLFPLLMLCVGTMLRLWIAHHRSYADMGRFGYAPLIPNLDLFLCGMSVSLIGPLVLPEKVRIYRGWILTAALATFYVFICAVTSQREHLHIHGLPELMAKGPVLCVLFASAFILLTEAGNKFPMRSGMTGKILWAVEWMGTLTYCLYVFHSDLFESVGGMESSLHSLSYSLKLFVPMMLVVFAVAYTIYRFVEKPFELRKQIGHSGLLDAP